MVFVGFITTLFPAALPARQARLRGGLSITAGEGREWAKGDGAGWSIARSAASEESEALVTTFRRRDVREEPFFVHVFKMQL